MLVRISLLFLTFFLVTAGASQSHQTELKYLIPDLGKLPPDLMQALKNNKSNPDIHQRGITTQQYLHVTTKNILDLTNAIEKDIGIKLNWPLEQLSKPGAVQEIRLMHKCFRESEQVKEQFQITLLGGDDVSRTRYSTPATLTPEQQQKIRLFFAGYSDKVSSEVNKLFFEITAKNSENEPILTKTGQPRRLQIDLFYHNQHGRYIPDFIDGEILFSESDNIQSALAASKLAESRHWKPSFLDREITHIQRLKTRNISDLGVPSFIIQAMEPFSDTNVYYLSQLLMQFRSFLPHHCFESTNKHRVFQKGFPIENKVLLNAEAFGFGPTSAIAEFFPYLRNRIIHLAYIGTGHTLDLQRKLPYDSIYDYSDTDSDNRRTQFEKIAKTYDVFITASDFEAASWAKMLGLSVIIYDPLTWYWPEIPPIIKDSDLYIAQNFYGVTERIEHNPKLFPDSRIVPPIISKLYDNHQEDDSSMLLVNFGGLSNPYMKQEVFNDYIKKVIQTLADALGKEYQSIHFLGGRQVAKAVNGQCSACLIETVQPQEVQRLLGSASLVILTSGLGNIFEAASMGKQALWLPPANDSQGQQIKLLAKHNLIDFAVDWHDLLPDSEPIDYFAPQPIVLKQISERMKSVTNDKEALTRLQRLTVIASQNKQPPTIRKLIDTFSFNGAKIAAENILQWLRTQNTTSDL